MALPEIDLFVSTKSVGCQQIRMLVAEKGIPCTLHDIDTITASELEPEFVKFSPKGTVPILVQGDVVKTETADILK